MSAMPEAARRLLEALVETEDRAIQAARDGGCQCNIPVPESDGRTYPFAIFDKRTAVGAPLDRIPWKMAHEPGCPMDGQEGVG
jgi:hypothetical protein